MVATTLAWARLNVDAGNRSLERVKKIVQNENVLTNLLQLPLIGYLIPTVQFVL